eukprot:gene11857-67110_t
MATGFSPSTSPDTARFWSTPRNFRIQVGKPPVISHHRPHHNNAGEVPHLFSAFSALSRASPSFCSNSSTFASPPTSVVPKKCTNSDCIEREKVLQEMLKEREAEEAKEQAAVDAEAAKRRSAPCAPAHATARELECAPLHPPSGRTAVWAQREKESGIAPIANVATTLTGAMLGSIFAGSSFSGNPDTAAAEA